MYARLEELGYRLTHFEAAVSTRPSRPEEAANLALPSGNPILAVTRVAWAGERAVEVNDMVLAGDRHELVYLLPADRPHRTAAAVTGSRLPNALGGVS